MTDKEEIRPLTPPALTFPPGTTVCRVSALNTTCNLTVPASTLVEPLIAGHEYFNLPTIAFLITHAPTGRRVLFDLGCKKDYWNLPPPIAQTIENAVPGMKIDQNVVDVLENGGVRPQELEAAVLSHHHYDHAGDISTFPTSMTLIVGRGFKKEFLPGYPSAPESPYFESDLKDRVVDEIDFSQCPTVAGYRAHDYFGDGSLCILDTPGHAIGHISALVRTDEDRYLFLGGDICHFGGSFRPTGYIPMPSTLTSDDLGPWSGPSICPCTAFLDCHPDKGNPRTNTYYRPCSKENSWYIDPPTAAQSIEQLKALDASDKILALIAHDPALLDIVPFFPDGDLNGWHKMDWKRQLRWRFLTELPVDDKPQKFLVDGKYKDGELVKPISRSTMHLVSQDKQ